MYNAMGLTLEEGSKKNGWSWKIHVFLAYFFAKIFYRVSLTVFFMVLGVQSMVVVVSYGQGMVLSFNMSHEEALWEQCLPFDSMVFKIYCLPLQYAKSKSVPQNMLQLNIINFRLFSKLAHHKVG